MKGPKGTIAEAIAKALDDYFVVEPSDIQTNLLSDAGVTLHDLELKPREGIPINAMTTASMTGIVSQVSFHWEWGQDHTHEGGSSWVKDVKFDMNGAKFRVVLRADADGSIRNTAADNETKTEQAKKKKGGRFKTYVQDQVDRIIDSLKISISDYELSIELPSSPDQTSETKSVVVGGADFQLDSLGRFAETDTLKQTLDIGKIFAHIAVTSEVGGGEARIYPFLDPLSYKASCVRVGGKRFTGGIQTGINVVGESIDGGITVHAGEHQLEAFNDLGGLLLGPKLENQAQNSESSSNCGEDEEEKIKLETTPKEESKPAQCDMNSSFFRLPLTGISLVFPNDTKLCMGGLVLGYQMDGNIAVLQGYDGFKVNGFPVLTVSNGGSGLWQADLVSSQFRVFDAADPDEKKDGERIVACVNIRDTEIQSIKAGAQELLDIFKSMSASKTGALASLASKAEENLSEKIEEKKEQTKKQWTFGIDGGLEFLMEGPENNITAEFLLHNFSASMASMSAKIGVIDKLCLPNNIRLLEPLENTTLSFDGSLFDLKVGNVVAKLEEPSPEAKPRNDVNEKIDPKTTLSSSTTTDSTDEPAPFVLPFGCKATIQGITVFETNGKSLHTTIKAIQFAIGPDASQDENNNSHTGGIRAVMVVDELVHDMISMTDPQLSTVVYPQDMSSVKKFEFGASSIAIAAGYSVFDWRRLLQTGDEKRERREKKKSASKSHKKGKDAHPLKMPFAKVHALKVRIAVAGDLVGTKGTTLHLKEFTGDADTTVNDLVKVYSSILITKVPGIVTNADILGFNIADVAAGQAGIVAGATALGALGGAAAPIAGVLGMVGFDGIRGTIQAGKKSRGADSDDKWHFTDLARGIGQAASDATRSGAAKRGKGENDKGDVLDWAVGATHNVAKYSDKNKSRLGGAGAGTAGFAFGMVLGGPVGAVAGALIASKTTSTTIDVIDHTITKKKKGDKT